jgi:RNA polymerase sigma-54 factor
MALSAKLQQKQSQSLVMTPQLLQSIRLLQFGSQELASYIMREVEKNPLLEIAEVASEASAEADGGFEPNGNDPNSGEGWDGDALAAVPGSVEDNFNSAPDNGYGAEAADIAASRPGNGTGDPWKSVSGALSLESAAAGLEAFCAVAPSLRGHLHGQMPLAIRNPADAMVAREIVESLDDDGYLRRPVSEIADALSTSTERVENLLRIVQTFDPPGIGGRDLGECLAIQLRDRNRFDPAMEALLGNLHLLARRDYVALSHACSVSIDDVFDMAGEIRNLDPRPGARFSSHPVQIAVPDIFVNPKEDGGWAIELNSFALPKVLVSREYYAQVTKNCRNESEKSFMVDCLQSANWLVKSLDQRAQTILKVAAEIVRQQDMFLAFGIEHLKPMTLRMVADSIGMHESTVSRVTSGKYIMTARGLFELKYFFTAPISSTFGANQHSAEAVRHRIRQLIDAERPEKVLSDDTIVKALRDAGIDIARRTVAKYRESMTIPSSVQRRREKQARRARRAS